MDDKLHQDLIKFEEELSKLVSTFEFIDAAKKTAETADNIIKVFQPLKNSFNSLTEQTKLLIDKIDKVDFPERLSSIHTALNSTNTNITNLQLKIELTERNLKDEFFQKVNILSFHLNNLDEKINQKLVLLDDLKSKTEIHLKQTIVNRWITIAGFVLMFLGILLIT